MHRLESSPKRPRRHFCHPPPNQSLKVGFVLLFGGRRIHLGNFVSEKKKMTSERCSKSRVTPPPTHTHHGRAFIVKLWGERSVSLVRCQLWQMLQAFGGRSRIRRRGARQWKVRSQGFGASGPGTLLAKEWQREEEGRGRDECWWGRAVVESGSFLQNLQDGPEFGEVAAPQPQRGRCLLPGRERTQNDCRWVGLKVHCLLNSLFFPSFYKNRHFGEKKQT